MELQFKKTACPCLGRAAREVKNTELTQELKLPDGMPDIGRVLTAWGQVILRSKEWRGDSASVSGGVMVWVLYAPEDGTDPRCVDTWIPFQIKWDISGTDREGPIRVLPLLRFADSRTVSARKMMVRAGVAAMVEALYPMEAEIYQAEELPADVELLKKTYPVRLPRESGEKTFLLDEDLTIPGTNPAPEKILSYTIRPEITDQKVMTNKVVFRGNAQLHLVYRCQEGRIRVWDFELPFSQFEELEGAYGTEAQTDIQMGTTSLELDLSDEGKLRLKCGLVAQYLVDDVSLLELVEDAYSPHRQTEIKTESLALPGILDKRQETMNAEQTIPGIEGEVLDVTFLPDFPRQRRVGDEIGMEVPGLFQVLYNAEDGAIQSASARWEGHWNLGAGEDSRIDSAVMTVGKPQASVNGEGIAVNGELVLQADTTTDHGIPMVSALELGEATEQDPNRPSLILCRPGKERLWDVAKRCGSTVAAIQRANSLENEPDADQILLIPVS